jgi:hypothetical protein
VIREDKPLKGLKRAAAPMAGHQALVGAVLKAAVFTVNSALLSSILIR